MAATETGDRKHLRWTAEALDEAIRSGIIEEAVHYEILNGELYEKMGQNWPHAFAIAALNLAFRSLDSERFYAAAQLPLRAGEDLPEPDFVVVRGSLQSQSGHPSADQAALVVEVSGTSLALDQKVKGPIYAVGGVPVYWIVDLNRGRVEVFSRPEGGAYAETRIFEAGDEIPPAFEGAPTVPVSDLLAPEK